MAVHEVQCNKVEVSELVKSSMFIGVSVYCI